MLLKPLVVWVLGHNFVASKTAQKLFKRFKEDDSNVRDRPRSGQPTNNTRISEQTHMSIAESA